MSSHANPNIDPYAYLGLLGLIRNSDGSITRTPQTPPPHPTENSPLPVLTNDIVVNQENKTRARIYLPQKELIPTKLPLLVYYHGGGFVVGNVEIPMFDKFCAEMSTNIPAVVVSVGYRLAPEHRLPTAYDDCLAALHWLKTSPDESLTQFADFSKCFLMGSSAGGNIVYHVGLRALLCVNDLLPLKIQGLILHQPFFGGVERTSSEVRLINDMVIPISLSDIMWELSLPVGVGRDSQYSNPMVGIKPNLLKKVKDQGWRLLVTGYGGDPCVDRQIEFVKMLEEKGIDVIGQFSDEGCHGCEFFDESKALILHGVLKNFVLI